MPPTLCAHGIIHLLAAHAPSIGTGPMRMPINTPGVTCPQGGYGFHLRQSVKSADATSCAIAVGIFIHRSRRCTQIRNWGLDGGKPKTLNPTWVPQTLVPQTCPQWDSLFFKTDQVFHFNTIGFLTNGDQSTCNSKLFTLIGS